MGYAVKEIFYTLQGEGLNAGRAAVFCRFAGCNLWSGREPDRAAAACRFCDTDFVGTNGPGGGRFSGASGASAAEELARAIAAAWAGGGEAGRFCVLTGGEPLLQVDDALLAALRALGFEIAVETNGTLPLPRGLDWVCVSPKGSAEVVVTAGDELKLVHPQPELSPERFEHLGFRHFLLQPMDGPGREASAAACVRYCLSHPRWRLSVQTHKILGIPLARQTAGSLRRAAAEPGAGVAATTRPSDATLPPRAAEALRARGGNRPPWPFEEPRGS